MAERYGLDTDSALGGSQSNDYVLPSQKAVKNSFVYIEDVASGVAANPYKVFVRCFYATTQNEHRIFDNNNNPEGFDKYFLVGVGTVHNVTVLNRLAPLGTTVLLVNESEDEKIFGLSFNDHRTSGGPLNFSYTSVNCPKEYLSEFCSLRIPVKGMGAREVFISFMNGEITVQVSHIHMQLVSKPNDFFITENVLQDYDGNKYDGITINGKMWMASNFMCTHYPDGTEITLKESGKTTSGYYTNVNSLDNTDKYLKMHGRLYNYQAAVNACPSGWHLPTKQEWMDMIEYVSAKPEHNPTGVFEVNEYSNLMARVTTDLTKSLVDKEGVLFLDESNKLFNENEGNDITYYPGFNVALNNSTNFGLTFNGYYDGSKHNNGSYTYTNENNNSLAGVYEFSNTANYLTSTLYANYRVICFELTCDGTRISFNTEMMDNAYSLRYVKD